MPVLGMHQKNIRDTGSKTLGFAPKNMLISEHGSTHTDDLDFSKHLVMLVIGAVALIE